MTAGERSQVMVSNMDVFSTILDYTGQSQDQGDCAVPSQSLKSLLSGNPKDWGEYAVYSEQEETRVVRTPKWAYFKRFGNAPNHPIDDELFDIEHDPSEIKNLVGDPAYADVRANLEDMLGKFFETYARPQADLWKGGAPLQHSERNEFWRDAWGNDWQPVYDYGQN